jgi:short-subunit dehydrogenase
MTDLGDSGLTVPLQAATAVITGASSGIGHALARRLVGEATSLFLIARGAERLEAVAAELRGAGAAVRTLRCDISCESELRAATASILGAGAVDLLVHSAGSIVTRGFAHATVEDFDRQWHTNVRGPFLLTQLLLPSLRARRGQVVFINSSAGLHAAPGVSQYAATKHALRALADSLRGEVNRDGVRVLSVFPGRTATPMQVELHRLEGRRYDPEALLQPDDVAAATLAALRLPRSAEVTDVRLRPMSPP